MKHLLLTILIFVFLSINTQAQDKKGEFADHIIIGTGVGLQVNTGNVNPDLVHSEFAWISNASISLTKRIHLGAEYRFIQLRGSTVNLSLIHISEPTRPY